MSTAEPNPYDSAALVKTAEKPWTTGRIFSRASSWAIVLVALLPTLYIGYVLSIHYVVLSANPTSSYRPVLFIISIPLSLLTAFAVAIIAAILNAFGSDGDTDIMPIAMGLCTLPVFLSFFGPFVICLLTGSSFGS